MLSFVIPVYKTPRECLSRCVDSVLSYPDDCEIICVLDSPGDAVEALLDDYAARHVIRLLKNETNKGVSFSRNRGLAESKGEYVAFVDADDAIDGAGYASIVKKMSQWDLDVCALMMRSCENGAFGLAPHAFVHSCGISNPHAFTSAVEMIGIGAYSAIYRKSYLTDTGSSFPLGISNNEDFVFATRVVSGSPKVKIGAYCIHAYHVMGHPESASRSKPTAKRYLSVVQAEALVLQALRKVNFQKDLMKWYLMVSIGLIFLERKLWSVITEKVDRIAYAEGVRAYAKLYCEVFFGVLPCWSFVPFKVLAHTRQGLMSSAWICIYAYVRFVRRFL